MISRISRWCLLLLVCAGTATAQTDGLLQVGDELHRFLERQQAAGRLPHAHLSHQPLSAYEAGEYLDSLDVGGLSTIDRALLDGFRGEGASPGRDRLRKWFGWSYTNGRDWFSAADDDWAVQVNPLLIVSYGKGSRTGGESPTVWQNSRGARISGRVGPHVYFEGRFTENQQRIVWANRSRRAGDVRLDDSVLDWMDAMGMVGFRSKHFEVRFGRDRNKWGNAVGSATLSNFAPPYDQLQIRTRFWRLEYTSLFSGFSSSRASGAASGDQIRRRKYGSLHRLAVHLPGRIELGFFESIIFATDSLEVRERFDLSYLNPVIFFRPVERDRGSPDNALLGASIAWQAVPGVRLYGEALIDEFKPSNFGKGWWANKWAFSGGAHVANWPVDGLSVRAEVTRLRPFLYSHDDEIDAYVHFGDGLGHPAGPNAWDYALFVDWQAAPQLRGALNLAYTRLGRNGNGINYGRDPTASYNTRVGEFDHWMLQGIRQNILLIEASAGYELLPALFVEAVIRMESLDDAETGLDRYVTPFFQLRWGLPFPSIRY